MTEDACPGSMDHCTWRSDFGARMPRITQRLRVQAVVGEQPRLDSCMAYVECHTTNICLTQRMRRNGAEEAFLPGRTVPAGGRAVGIDGLSHLLLGIQVVWASSDPRRTSALPLWEGMKMKRNLDCRAWRLDAYSVCTKEGRNRASSSVRFGT